MCASVEINPSFSRQDVPGWLPPGLILKQELHVRCFFLLRSLGIALNIRVNHKEMMFNSNQ